MQVMIRSGRPLQVQGRLQWRRTEFRAHPRSLDSCRGICSRFSMMRIIARPPARGPPRVMDALQRAIPAAQIEIGPDRALRRNVLGQSLPLAARRQHIEDAVQNLAHINRAIAAAVFSGWDHGLNDRPFGPQSNHSDNEDRCDLQQGGVPASTSGPPREVANQAPNGITTDSSDSTTSWIGSQTCFKRLA